MSRAERWASMGLNAWDEWEPDEIRRINKGRPPDQQFKPSVIPGVVITTTNIPTREVSHGSSTDEA
jgi:hypothetical protein